MKKILITTAVSAAALLGSVACVPTVAAPDQTPRNTSSPEESTPAPVQEEETPQEMETSETDGLFDYEVRGGWEQDSFADVFGDAHYPDEDHFYVVEVTATNVSSSPASAPDPWVLDHLYVIDSEGRVHASDDEPWTGSFDVNPGASLTYEVAWDLPSGVEVEYVELFAYEAPGVAVLEAP